MPGMARNQLLYEGSPGIDGRTVKGVGPIPYSRMAGDTQAATKRGIHTQPSKMGEDIKTR